MKTCLSIIICFIFLPGCRKEAKISLPEQEEKLVVTCFISPEDSIITAVVRTSKPKFTTVSGTGSDGEVIPNAEIVLSREGASITVPFVDSLNCYALRSSDFPVVPGILYTMHVKTPDGKNTSASTTVPVDTMNIKKFEVALNFSQDSSRLDVVASGTAADDPDRTNYVALYYRQFIFPADSMSSGYEYFNYGAGIFEDDENQPRQTYRLQQQVYSMETSPGKVDFDGMYAEFWVLNCSREFYLYNRSVQLAAYSGGNPFGDPVLVYTNMSDGFGCFGAYRVSKRSVLH